MRVRIGDEKSRAEGVLECVCCGVEFGYGQRQRREWLRVRARDEESRLEGVLERVCCGVELAAGKGKSEVAK